jgi:hypothetical protein
VSCGWLWTREEPSGECAQLGGRDGGGGSEAVPVVGRGGQRQPAGAWPGRGAIIGGAAGARVKTPAAAAQPAGRQPPWLALIIKPRLPLNLNTRLLKRRTVHVGWSAMELNELPDRPLRVAACRFPLPAGPERGRWTCAPRSACDLLFHLCLVVAHRLWVSVSRTSSTSSSLCACVLTPRLQLLGSWRQYGAALHGFCVGKKIQCRRVVKHHPCSPILDVSHMSVREMRRFRSSSSYARSGRLPLAPCSLTSRRLELMGSLSSFLSPTRANHNPHRSSVAGCCRRTHRSSVAASLVSVVCHCKHQSSAAASLVHCQSSLLFGGAGALANPFHTDQDGNWRAATCLCSGRPYTPTTRSDMCDAGRAPHAGMVRLERV